MPDQTRIELDPIYDKHDDNVTERVAEFLAAQLNEVNGT
jgi:hypothetical protein